MPKYFPRQLLFRLRNEIPLERVIAEHLNWPSKRREGRFSFVCPRCGESLPPSIPKPTWAAASAVRKTSTPSTS